MPFSKPTWFAWSDYLLRGLDERKTPSIFLLRNHKALLIPWQKFRSSPHFLLLFWVENIIFILLIFIKAFHTFPTILFNRFLVSFFCGDRKIKIIFSLFCGLIKYLGNWTGFRNVEIVGKCWIFSDSFLIVSLP